MTLGFLLAEGLILISVENAQGRERKDGIKKILIYFTVRGQRGNLRESYEEGKGIDQLYVH